MCWLVLGLKEMFTCLSGKKYEMVCIFRRKERVPIVFHNPYINELNSIAQLLIIYFMDKKYFPMQLSNAFIIHIVLGEIITN